MRTTLGRLRMLIGESLDMPGDLNRMVADNLSIDTRPYSFPGDPGEDSGDVSPDFVRADYYGEDPDWDVGNDEWWIGYLQRSIEVSRKTTPRVAHKGWYVIRYSGTMDPQVVEGPYETREQVLDVAGTI